MSAPDSQLTSEQKVVRERVVSDGESGSTKKASIVFVTRQVCLPWSKREREEEEEGEVKVRYNTGSQAPF